MSPKKQRIAIAAACGWKLVPRLFHNGQWKEVPTWVERKLYDGKPEDYCAPGQVMGAMPPYYLSDLNAMAEAEKAIRCDNLRRDYIEHLKDVCEAHAGAYRSVERLVKATALQRAEAFLRTLNLYKES